MEFESDFRPLVKDALEHLYDTAYLETHPLLDHFPVEPAASRISRAQKLRGLLKEGVEALRPQEGAPAGSPQWRIYLALRYRYVQGQSPVETAAELGISLRQLQRELHKGVDAAATLLWERRAESAARPESARTDLEVELGQWELERQRCDLHALVSDTLWMSKPLLEETGAEVQIGLPSGLAPVFVDPTLTRQVLFKLIRALVRGAPGGTLLLRADQRKKNTYLNLLRRPPSDYARQEDWSAALLIAEQQGLGIEDASSDDETRLSVVLPHAAQPLVLVIDDNVAIHRLFERYLAPNHYEVVHAYNGPEALEIASARPPDAITLDVMMPNVDGWQVLRSLTGSPSTARIPIIICSVLREPELALSLGARAYLKKPVERLELVSTLNRLLAPEAPAAAGTPPRPGHSRGSHS